MKEHARITHEKIHTDLPVSFMPGYTDAVAPSSGEMAARQVSPYDGFSLSVATKPEVSGVSIEYTLLHEGREAGQGEQPLAFSRKFDREGNKIWNLLAMPMPRGGQVRYRLTYTIGKETVVDDNQGQGYLATVG